MNFLIDRTKIPFNEWLAEYGIFIAIGVAGVLLIIIGVLLILNAKKKR